MNISDKQMHALYIRSKHWKRKVLMNDINVDLFTALLRKKIGKELMIVSTSLGIEVFYFSENKKDELIKEMCGLFLLRDVTLDTLRYETYQTEEEV